jgi:CBS domain containing-hemolysin-like protein
VASNRTYKKVLMGFFVGLGVALVLSSSTRNKIKKLVLDKSENALPNIKEKIEQYLNRISEAIAVGKAAFQQREDELELRILHESQRKEQEKPPNYIV